MAEIDGQLLEKWLLLIQTRLDAIDHKLAAIDDHVASIDRKLTPDPWPIAGVPARPAPDISTAIYAAAGRVHPETGLSR